jgi:hypothetical protein
MPKVDMADTGVMANTANILVRCRNEADTRLAEAGRNSAGRDRAKHIEAGAAVNGAAVTGPAVHGTAVTGTAVTGVGTHIGAGVTLTRTRTTAIILTGTILRTGTSMTTAPYQDGDIFTPDPSVILFRRVTTL